MNMRKRIGNIFSNRKKHGDYRGFTLVELIVVLVILAILAAILIPALLGYVDRAKESQDMLKAKNMLQAAQTVLTEYYANGTPLTYGFGAAKSPLGNRIREVADDDPYMVIIGVGANGTQLNNKAYETSKHEQYTAFFVAYWEDKNEPPLFFDGKDWSMNYPWGEREYGESANFFYVNGKKINLSFIFVADKSGTNQWNEIQSAVKKFGHTYSQAGKTK